jgi:hypothetical protein
MKGDNFLTTYVPVNRSRKSQNDGISYVLISGIRIWSRLVHFVSEKVIK